MSRKNTVKKLVKKYCANYDANLNNINHYCCIEHEETNQCSFFIDKNGVPSCKYFEECILPLDKELQIIYHAEQEKGKLSHYDKKKVLNQIDQEKREIRCERCDKPIKAKSNRQKYCDNCARVVRNEKQSKIMKKNRRNEK